jgi:ubiquitin-conjugating enzyme E2 Z
MNILSTLEHLIDSLSYRTWRGERGEEWSSAQGLESILISIQSLMSSNPYENEPGFEDAKEPQDKKNQKDYVMKVNDIEPCPGGID